MSLNFSGSLATKKKGDLSEICSALGISNLGTREELQSRIRDHLDEKPQLADNPTYSGLYPKKRASNARKPSVAPAFQHEAESTEDDSPPQPRKVSRILKAPTPNTPLPPPPPSPVHIRASPVRSLLNDVAFNAAPDAQAVVEAVVEVEAKFVSEAEKMLGKARSFLSNAGNISSITLLAELIFIMCTIIPWAWLLIPLAPPFKTTVDKKSTAISAAILSIPYPPLSYLLSTPLYKTATTWAIPTLIIPQLFGALISFSSPRKEVDPLSASIVRLAITVGGTWGLDDNILSSKWRILSAAISVAFALAEAVNVKQDQAVLEY